MDSYENKGIEYHDEATKKRSTQIGEKNNAECKSKNGGMHPVEAENYAAYTVLGLR
ncbi:MAG: hypothetical protein LQ348_007468 [Seirophora lacunosa]|nr:MAG: hypothetical protein LQ348_007468 [Seirophora lacunosa]